MRCVRIVLFGHCLSAGPAWNCPYLARRANKMNWRSENENEEEQWQICMRSATCCTWAKNVQLIIMISVATNSSEFAERLQYRILKWAYVLVCAQREPLTYSHVRRPIIAVAIKIVAKCSNKQPNAVNAICSRSTMPCSCMLQIDSSLAVIRSSWEFTAAILIYRFLISHSARRTRASKLFYSYLGYVCVAECVASIIIRLAKRLATWQLCAKRKSGVCFGFFLVFWLKLVFISFYQFCYRFALNNWID